ncbi:MAG: 50S ribosomal protein L30 [bacterium]
MAGKVKVTLKRSLIGRVPKHRRTVEALGLGKIGQSRIINNTPQLQGMIKQVAYLLDVEEIEV